MVMGTNIKLWAYPHMATQFIMKKLIKSSTRISILLGGGVSKPQFEKIKKKAFGYL
jgi:copper homeostasis protein CutC